MDGSGLVVHELAKIIVNRVAIKRSRGMPLRNRIIPPSVVAHDFTGNFLATTDNNEK
jgi:hypothetical protein